MGSMTAQIKGMNCTAATVLNLYSTVITANVFLRLQFAIKLMIVAIGGMS